tara:strand:- start:178 stop:1023 length:846 start_codon:yes stop_codon:yes gene_type:complete
MKKKVKQLFKVRGEEVEVFLVPEEYEMTAGYGQPYPNLQEQKREITLDQDKKDKQELAHETLKDMVKHHEGAIKNLKAEIAALQKDMKEDEGDIRRESDANMTKKQFDKIDKRELKRDTKKEKVEHEKDAIKDDKEKIKKLQKGKPSEKKDAEKRALKKDMKFDKQSKEKMEGDAIRGYPPRRPVMAEMVKDGQYVGKPPKKKAEGDAIRGYPRKPVMAEMTDKQKSGLDKNKDGKITKEDFEMLRKGKKKSDGKNGKKIKPKTSYAEILRDIAAERFGKK